MDDQYDVFLCYNAQDRPVVLRLAKALQERGITVWLDIWDLIPGRPWMRVIQYLIESEKVLSVAALVGPDGYGPWQEEEVEAFLIWSVKHRLQVIPVLLPNQREEKELPPFLGNRTWVSFHKKLSKKSLDLLIAGIRGDKPGSPAVSPQKRRYSSSEPIVMQYNELQLKLALTASDGSEVAAPKAQTRQAQDQGGFDQAENALNQAGDLALDAARKVLEEAKETADKNLLSAAASNAEAGNLKMTQLAYADAAYYYGYAVNLVPPGYEEIKACYLIQREGALKGLQLNTPSV
ncbi:MAG: toll/interleukin-1 receptor domain-containing protein [Deltaproteobacteria bacterium]|nr:toll/interleukin-1 receptor domain-containing protein [Deltaproteobacteria bacterium]